MTSKPHGGPPASPLLVRAVELCEDGEWHDYEALLAELAKLVEPGKAMRRAEKDRLATGGPPRRTKGSVARVMASGKRSIARDFVRAPYFEVKPRGRLPRGEARSVRLVQLPARLMWARTLAAQERSRTPDLLIPLLLKQEPDEVKETLGKLDEKHLQRLVEALVTRMKTSEANWIQW